jgi:hypothetical protein
MSLIYIKRRMAFVRHHGLEIYQLRRIKDLRAAIRGGLSP